MEIDLAPGSNLLVQAIVEWALARVPPGEER